MQNRARVVTGNYETGSINRNLNWESLTDERKQSMLLMLCKGLKGKVSIFMGDRFPTNKFTRNMHPISIQIFHARTNISSFSVFPMTVSDRN